MILYRYRSADGRNRALSASRSGDRLPGTLSEWQYLGPASAEDARLGVSAAVIAASIETDGYFRLPDV